MGKRPEQTLFPGGHTEDLEAMTGCSASLAVREMQIETTMRYHTSRNGYQKQINKQCGEKGTLVQLVGMQTGEVTVENSVEFP